jgi:hypothetical protein
VTAAPTARQEYGWAGTVQQFLATNHQTIINALSSHVSALHQGSPPDPTQLAVWADELSVLTGTLSSLSASHPTAQQWGLILEYELPQQSGRRPDVIVLAGSSVIVLEFKMKSKAGRGDFEQLVFYVRDLSNYHSVAQRSAGITGALVLTKAQSPTKHRSWELLDKNSVASFLVRNAGSAPSGQQISCASWLAGKYQPSPGLLTAAINGWLTSPPQLPPHFATNVPQVKHAIQAVIAQAQNDPPTTRHIIIVTGVPGAGKSFLGLDLVHDASVPGGKRFVSGNGPLVSVLNRALNQTEQFVTPLHKFRNYYGNPQHSPSENLIIFDEAQRTLDQAYMTALEGKNHSEAHVMLDIISRTPGWGVLVLLAGTGQEIYKGESGLQIWFDELATAFPNVSWKVHCSTNDITYLNPTPPALPPNVSLQNGAYHLNVAIRQHGAIEAAQWVEHVLNGDSQTASQCAQTLGALPGKTFLLYVTRNLAKAETVTHGRYAGQPAARFGLLAVSGNEKYLESHGAPVVQDRGRGGNPPVDDIADWYLNPVSQPTSCGSLRKAATEFQCQGLDLDSTIVCWANDLVWDKTNMKWKIKPVNLEPPVPNPAEMRLNKYRVVLTRARDGMTIFVPPNKSLDDTYHYLVSCGAVPLP